MATKKKTVPEPSAVRQEIEVSSRQAAKAPMPFVMTQVAGQCKECRVANAFHAWRSQHLTPSFNWFIDFTESVSIPSDQRAVIELVTATITVPAGERARLRMFTSLGSAPSNLDFVLIPQGQVGVQERLVATHSVRVYSDNLVQFSVNRDNAQTEGEAFICISGYFIDV